MKYLLATILSFSIVFILTPILMKLAFKYNFTDKPTKRKNIEVIYHFVEEYPCLLVFLYLIL